MRKVTLTLMMFVGAISISMAQSTAGNESTTREVKTEKSVILTEKKPAKEVKSVNMLKVEPLPKKEEVIIEEKKTNKK